MAAKIRQLKEDEMDRKEVVLGKDGDASEAENDEFEGNIAETIRRIKEAKRLKMAAVKEDVQDGQPGQHNRDTDDVGSLNSKITAGKDDYQDGHSRVADEKDEVNKVNKGTDNNASLSDAPLNEDDVSDIKDAYDAAVKEGKVEDGLTDPKEQAKALSDAGLLDVSGEGEGKDEGEKGDEALMASIGDKISKQVGAEADETPANAKDERAGTEKEVEKDNDKIDAGKDVVEDAPIVADNGAPIPDADEDDENYVDADDFDINEDLKAIFGDGKGLSEAFKEKTKSIYEAAVVAKANQVVKEAMRIMKEDLRAYRAGIKENYANKINDYLSVIVEEWAVENKQVLVENTKYDLSQSFLTEMNKVYNKFNIRVPKDKVDLFDKVLEENIKLEDQINKLLVEKVDLTKRVQKTHKDRILRESANGLSDNQKTKLKMLSEAITFKDEKDYTNKLNEIKKAYFTKATKRGSIERDSTAIELKEDVRRQDDGVASSVEAVARLFK